MKAKLSATKKGEAITLVAALMLFLIGLPATSHATAMYDSFVTMTLSIKNADGGLKFSELSSGSTINLDFLDCDQDLDFLGENGPLAGTEGCGFAIFADESPPTNVDVGLKTITTTAFTNGGVTSSGFDWFSEVGTSITSFGAFQVHNTLNSTQYFDVSAKWSYNGSAFAENPIDEDAFAEAAIISQFFFNNQSILLDEDGDFADTLDNIFHFSGGGSFLAENIPVAALSINNSLLAEVTALGGAFAIDGAFDPVPIPEPATMLLLGSGLLGLAGFFRRRLKK